MQIFAGGVPIYRGAVLVGAIGVSGDGIDQDDMIAFLGANNAHGAGAGIGNAPVALRDDAFVVRSGGSSLRLRYVSCPYSPYLTGSAQNVCAGL